MSRIVVILLIAIFAAAASTNIIKAKCLVSKVKFDIYEDYSDKFVTVKASKEALKEAQKVVVTKQNVPILCKDFFSTSNLRTIEVTHNKLEQIDVGAFVSLPYLYNLLLNNNNLKEIPSKIFDDLTIRKLNLSHNAIEKIAPDAFAKLPNLDVIDLSNNKLAYVDVNWFKSSSKLGWLILDNNYIEILPEGFLKFDEKDDIFIDIYIRNNRIKKIEPNAIQNVNTINSCFLDGNQLETIPTIFKNVKKVRTMFLVRNAIKCIDEKVIENLKICRDIYMQENPLDCDCWQRMKNIAEPLNLKLVAFARTMECYRKRMNANQKE